MKRNNKILALVFVFLLVLAVSVAAYFYNNPKSVEYIPPAPHADLIRIFSPLPNAEIQSPLVIRGEARGNWYFEASFPVKLYDANGKDVPLTPGYIMANGEWMTTEFVPFEASLKFTKPATATGTLVLMKDNPSGLPEHDAQIEIPVRFIRPAVSTPTPALKPCVIGGCSGQICADESMASTCEYRAEYGCYKNAECKRQANGKCGWTQTVALNTCIATANSSGVQTIY